MQSIRQVVLAGENFAHSSLVNTRRPFFAASFCSSASLQANVSPPITPSELFVGCVCANPFSPFTHSFTPAFPHSCNSLFSSLYIYVSQAVAFVVALCVPHAVAQPSPSPSSASLLQTVMHVAVVARIVAQHGASSASLSVAPLTVTVSTLINPRCTILFRNRAVESFFQPHCSANERTVVTNCPRRSRTVPPVSCICRPSTYDACSNSETTASNRLNRRLLCHSSA